MRRRLSRDLAPHLPAAGLLAWLLFPLLSPANALASRDIVFFHLPLRDALRRLAAEGIPWWNPSLHGGQPILSNPNYQAFYPPTWFTLALPAHYALSLLLVLHAAIAYAGAWRLARRLGCRRPAALLAALGFVAGGAYLSLSHVFTLLCGIAWLPWVLAWGDAWLRAPHGAPRRLLPALGCGAALALQILAGDPSPPVVSVLGLASLAIFAARHRRRALIRLGLPLALGVALAAIQLAPTLARLGDSPRAGGVDAEDAAVWSTRPARLLEAVWPRAFGDPSRAHENLYFGGKLNDRDFPFLVSIYSGQLLLILALAALARWPIPRRGAWAGMILLGVFLALGRHNPLFLPLVAPLPPFSLIRYPERYLLLALVGIVFAGALGWQHLLDERRRGRPERADFPLALAALLAGVPLVVRAAMALRPRLAENFVAARSLVPLAPEALAEAAAFLGRQAALAAAVGTACALLLLLHRLPRVPAALLPAATLILAGADFALYGRGAVQTLPADELLRAPPAAAAVEGRLFTDLAFVPRSEFVLRAGRSGPDALWVGLERLEPYSATLWGGRYVLHEDYDLMLTRWARHALDLLHEEWARPRDARRILGAWGVVRHLRNRPVAELLAARLRGEPSAPVRFAENRFHLPVFRFAPRVVFHPDREAAVAAARAERFRFRDREHWIDPAAPPGGTAPRRSAPDTRATPAEERGADIELRYEATEPAFFVAAVTFDPRWRALLDGRAVDVYPTAAGQIGVELPPGSHRLVLRYRDPWVPAGATLSLLAAAFWGVLLVRAARRPPAEPARGVQ